jgi:hypothetical protein
MASFQPRVIEGAYVSLDQLLALRFRPAAGRRRPTSTFTGAQTGLRLSKHKGRGVDFAEVRQYQTGDDIRSIDWRVTARKNAPHTKVFREERERPALIFVDQGQHMFFGVNAATEIRRGRRTGGSDRMANHRRWRPRRRHGAWTPLATISLGRFAPKKRPVACSRKLHRAISSCPPTQDSGRREPRS